jgi:hypothetical protein
MIFLGNPFFPWCDRMSSRCPYSRSTRGDSPNELPRIPGNSPPEAQEGEWRGFPSDRWRYLSPALPPALTRCCLFACPPACLPPLALSSFSSLICPLSHHPNRDLAPTIRALMKDCIFSRMQPIAAKFPRGE